MSFASLRNKTAILLSLAGIKIDGDAPWDIHVHNDNLYSRLMAKGSLGLGESYMDGWWDCDSLDQFFSNIFRAKLDTRVKSHIDFFNLLKSRVLNLQKPSRAFEVGQRHYDIGNDVYRCMLDKYMIYSCAYWKNATTLDKAQEDKLDLVCRKLYLRPGMRVLDIGCGWGGAARFMAERYNVEVLGLTISEEQVDFAKEFCKGLPVEIRLQDYRDLSGTFDRIISIGMFEHVGYKNYPAFFDIVRESLTDNGLFLLHTIGKCDSDIKTDPWIARYIFPNSMLPSAKQICAAIEGLLVIEDWHNFGPDYDRTLMNWFYNFDKNWATLKNNYSERFYRMWKYYLLSCAGAFRARANHLWQIVLSPTGIPEGYCSLR